MNDGIIIQQVYKNRDWLWNVPYGAALDLVYERHLKYSKKWNFDYLVARGEVKVEWKPNNGGWAKLELIRQALAKGYKYICWIDADAVIVDMNTDLRTGCPEGLGMVMHTGPLTPGPHLNVGIMLMQNTPRVRELFDEWVTRYPGTQEFPWHEQGEAHKLAHDPKWKGVIIQIDKKWNSCVAALTHVDDAVIEGWHGMGDPTQRLEQMRRYMTDVLHEPIELEGGLSRPRAKRGEVEKVAIGDR
jgi:hypothetical protein